MSGHSIQNSMTNKNGRTIIKNKRDFAVFVFVCEIRFKVPSHVREYEYKPGNLFFHVILLGVVFVFVSMCENPHQNNIRMQ